MAFYLQPPGGNISLQKLATYAETRFRFLSQVYQTNGDRMKLQDIVLDTEAVEESECLIESSVKDKISHFILRLAFSESREMRNFLLTAETILFDFRFSCMTKDELNKCFHSLDQYIKNIDSYHDQCLGQILSVLRKLKDRFHGWKKLVQKYLNGSRESMEVPFETVLQLVAKREVLITKGMASVPLCKLRELATSLFSQILAAGLKEADQAVQTSNRDARISKLCRKLQGAYNEKLGQGQNPGSVVWSLNHEDVDTQVKLFPPCMSQLHACLRQQHRLGHHARVQYTLFLKEAGLPVHEALMFWRKEYSQPPSNNSGCCHSWTENENRYTYNIRHLYGLEGSRINYRGHSCLALQDMHVGPSCEGGCPFSHYDSSHLYRMLKTYNIGEKLQEILDLSSQGKYTDACQMCLVETIKHNRCDQAGHETCKEETDKSEAACDDCEFPQPDCHTENSDQSSESVIVLNVTFLAAGQEENVIKEQCNENSNDDCRSSDDDVSTSESETNLKSDLKTYSRLSSQLQFGSDSSQSDPSLSNSKIIRDSSNRPTKRGCSDFLEKPASKVQRTDSKNDSHLQKEACDKTTLSLTISKPTDFYLLMKRHHD